MIDISTFFPQNRTMNLQTIFTPHVSSFLVFIFWPLDVSSMIYTLRTQTTRKQIKQIIAPTMTERK